MGSSQFQDAYVQGQTQAFVELGLYKYAEEGEGPTLAQTGLMAGAVAAPFVGMPSTPAFVHDPRNIPDEKNFKTLRELSQAAQPGDVVLSTFKGVSPWKQTQSAFTGSEYHHASPVIGRRGGHGVAGSAGEYMYMGDKDPARQLRAMSQTVEEMHPDYTDFVLMRPKSMTPEQAKAFSLNAIRRARQPYSHETALASWAHEVFAPRRKALENAAAGVSCEGNVCSTLPAQAYKEVANLDVLPGKPANRVLPADFLRSENFELVGAHSPNVRTTAPISRATPYLARAGLGVALAGGAYGATEHPDVAAPALGAVAAHQLAPRLFSEANAPQIGHVWDTIRDSKAYAPGEASAIRSKYLSRRFLPGLIGGGAAYAGLQGLRSLMGSKESVK